MQDFHLRYHKTEAYSATYPYYDSFDKFNSSTKDQLESFRESELQPLAQPNNYGHGALICLAFRLPG